VVSRIRCEGDGKGGKREYAEKRFEGGGGEAVPLESKRAQEDPSDRKKELRGGGRKSIKERITV